MQREDAHIIKALHKTDPAFAELYLRNPYFPLDDETYSKLPAKYADYLPHDWTVQDALNILPFRDFVFQLTGAPEEYRQQVKDLQLQAALHIRIDEEQDPSLPWSHINFSAVMLSTVVFPGYNEPRLITTTFASRHDKQTGKIGLYGSSADTTELDALKAYANTVHTAISYMYWAQEQDLYPIEVRGVPHSPKYGAASKKPWTREDLPRTIFLNRLPSDTPSCSTGTGTTKSGHPRRGHWHRLMHERFRNHPKYGSRIRIRPTWVGPTNASYRGHVYKLIQEPYSDKDL